MNLHRALAILWLVLALTIPSAQAGQVLKLATTTSTENTGLLEVLNPPFEKQQRVRLDVIAVGTGKAIKLGENGDVDVVLVHDPEAEEKFVAAGHGVDRTRVMHNDFVIVGPKSDPAGVRTAKSGADALRMIAEAKAGFVSRGDESGTHIKERKLWQASKLTPDGPWYLSAGQGMGAVLRMADEKGYYTLSDRATFLAYRDKVGLELLYEGDPLFLNIYHVIAVNPKKHRHANYRMAKEYIRYLTGKEGQALIGQFRANGQLLFHPDVLPGR